MIDTNNLEKAKKLIKEEKKPVVIVSQNDEFNRKILEYGKFDVLMGVENGTRKNSIRQIDSGFNHVLGAIAAKKKIAFGIDVGALSLLEKKEKALRIEKIRQNLRICRRSGVKIVLLNLKDRKDGFSFLSSVGASSRQAKEAISF